MLLGLILIGSSSRLLIADLPNFKPLAAIALFSGFYFRSLPMALLATAMSLLISDWQIGSYHWPIAASVYGSLLAGCLAGRYFIGATSFGATSFGATSFGKRREGRFSKNPAFKSVTAALSMSILFFVVTNFTVWATGSWYPTTLAGLIACYANAIPFFKYTIAGDLIFTACLFGTYATVSAMTAKKTQPSLIELNT